MQYDFSKIEKKWQKKWEEQGLYNASDASKKDKKYILIEFPYPSGEGLHMGHLRPYVAGDVYSRWCRMQGFETLYPIGWDAFGLPAENFAIKKGIHPSVSTASNIKNAKAQVKSWGIGFDWSREINTTDPAYYKWTQWIFLKLFEKGLAYEATGKINWCPKDKTGLANEEVVNGKCERCGTEVEQKELRQWYLKITAYAEKLLEGLKSLDWPERIKIQQENWIGKSEGVDVDFIIEGSVERLTVYTTRVDTIFSGTFMVLAPEHPLVGKITTTGCKKEVAQYIKKALKKTEIERTNVNKIQEGVFTGSYAINPASGERMPIWISDFVIAGYGLGAVFADAHDERDFAMAKRYNIPLKVSIRPADNELWKQVKDLEVCFSDEGVLVHSGQFDCLTSSEARKKITEWLTKQGKARAVVKYRLRDWVFSRQRYWGEPIPLVHCEKCGIVPVPEKDLPVVLPDVKKYEPTGTGESPLAVIKDWVNTICPRCGGPAKRETNTMPQWAGSSWYYLRYTDPNNSKEFAGEALLKQWLPVDVYFGGMEHTTLHLLYSRFWHQFLYDEKIVPTPEPYALRIPHGIILGADGEKMSKSRGNVANPDKLVLAFGADALRMHELFLGPHDASVTWNDQGILGISRFLERVWRKYEGDTGESKGDVVARWIHRTAKKVGDDIHEYKFNTAISSLMICLNETERFVWDKDARTLFSKLLAPFAPHITEELWHELGNSDSIHRSAWPVFNPVLTKEEIFDLVVQINGKHRETISVPRGIKEQEAKSVAMKNTHVANHLKGATIKKVIFVPDRLINFVL